MSVKSILSRLNPRLKWRGVRGIRYNEEGVSAVEFALIAPVLILIYLGAVELSLLMRGERVSRPVCGEVVDDLPVGAEALRRSSAS